MKKIIVSIILLAMSISLIAQQLPAPDYKLRDEYLKKSKRQKTTANIMLLAGGVSVAAGTIMFMTNGLAADGSEDEMLGGVGLATVGVLSMAGSIPFYIISGNNKRKAMEFAGGINLERGRNQVYYPAVAVRIHLK
jgi:hypothetical protein